MTRGIRIHETGGAEVMALEEYDLPAPEPGMITIANEAIGINFIDTYHRSGLYPIPLPSGLGVEGAGTVSAVGEGTDFKPGDRVVYCMTAIGAYAEEVNLSVDGVVKIPDGVSTEQAAAIALKGATVEYLLQRTYPLKAGETCLFHAAAGGVGLIFGQWANALGATTIGTVGSEEKADLARNNGYQHVINYRTENIVERVLEITGSDKLPVVYDGVGKDTFVASLDCLRPRGLMVSFGNASGAPEPLDLQMLAARGSLFITRPSLPAYLLTPEERKQCFADVFSQLSSGNVKLEINQRYALAEAQQAHLDLEARRTTGSSILVP